MNTPIVDFVSKYADRGGARFHMPGHKGKTFLGCEAQDITEIFGADTLYSADGIIDESENNASELFGTSHTFYSAEGSTLAVKAMLALATAGKPRVILAARNVHKSFIYACALLDIEVAWIYPSSNEHLCSCSITAQDVEDALRTLSSLPSALYLTSPDYLGQMLDIEAISSVCKKYGVTLLIDNAHGAYLRFLPTSRHPVSLGADICCDSAHKTLPVLTGGAYLHISKTADRDYLSRAREMLSVFSSTSPSYLILESLDLCNRYLSDGYTDRLAATVEKLDALKKELSLSGFKVEETEPLKLVINAAKYGYTGAELAHVLRERSIELEFSDDEYAVFMVTPENTDAELKALFDALTAIPRKEAIKKETLSLNPCSERVCSIREAIFSPSEMIDITGASGRVCASPTVSCPPAIPIAVSGERITDEAVRLFKSYGIDKISVIKDKK